MSLPEADREYIRLYAGAATPSSLPGIHVLASMYMRGGTATAREVTDVIHPRAYSGTYGYFGGFIAGTNSDGFRRAVRDPDAINPQTGHFFSFVVWALDGISEFEAAAALGHEFVSDHVPWHIARQGISGVSEARAFRDFLTAMPLDPNGCLDYAQLDCEFAAHGWSDDIHPIGHGWSRMYVSGGSAEVPVGYAATDRPGHTGNSIQDLRCTVAGFHFGKLIRCNLFRNSVAAATWLENNILDGTCRVGFDAEDRPTLLAEAPAI